MVSKSDKTKRYAGRSQQPKCFAPLLKAMNSLVKNEEFPSMHEVRAVLDWLDSHTWVNRYIRQLWEQSESLTLMSPTQSSAIGQKNDVRDASGKVLYSYRSDEQFLLQIGYGDFLKARQAVLDIVRNNELQRTPNGYLFNYKIALGFDEHGVLIQMPDQFLRMVLNTEVERLRRCGLCGKIFWASRKDMQGCSQKCSDVLRKRKARALLAEKATEYEANRAAKEQKGKSK